MFRRYDDDDLFFSFKSPSALLTRRLFEEYETILYQRKVRIRPCLIEVVPMSAKWGEWNSGTRTIRISQSLVDTYAWTTVVEVLKHEMAHQYVSEAFPIVDLHGNSFKKACDALGVAAWARTSSGELPDQIPSWRTKALSDESKRHIERVKKLLSLAASTNEHEATLAMQRAQEILAKHRLERVKLHTDSSCDFWFVPLRTKRVDATTQIIFLILREFYFVKPISTDYFDAKDSESYQAYDVAGNTEDLQMAEYVYEFLKRTVESLWGDHRKKTMAAGKVKRSYSLGVLRGFRLKLTESQAKRTLDSEYQALVVLDEKALGDFVKIRYPRLVNGSGVSGARHQDSYTAGVSDGRNIVLNKPISTSDGNRGRLLT